jgi:hypothetical protein
LFYGFETIFRQQHFWGGCAHLKKSLSAAV